VTTTAAVAPVALPACPPAQALLLANLGVLAPALPGVIGPMAVVQRLNNLLRQGLQVARGLNWSTPASGLSAVLQHVRNLADRATDDSGGGPDQMPPPMPAPVPLPTSLPTAPTEQGGSGGGSSISSGSHGHGGKGGGAQAVLGGALLVLFLSPLGMARRLNSSAWSRSLRPLALPG
jgi:hypothetical protein